MDKNNLGAVLFGVLIAACGGEQTQNTQPLDDLVKEAAGGDRAAMTELERRANETAAELESSSVGADAETAFQTALYSGKPDAVEQLSDAGNVWAQTHLAATISLQTDIGDEDADRARILLEAAADAGHGPALFRISEDYRSSGKLYPLDEDKAFEIGLEAAKAGHGEAMFLTGVRYQYGQLNAPQDKELARSWLEKAKAAGYAGAQSQLDELN